MDGFYEFYELDNGAGVLSALKADIALAIPPAEGHQRVTPERKQPDGAKVDCRR